MSDDPPFASMPDGLPSGRVVRAECGPEHGDDQPVLWVTDEPVPDAHALWARLHTIRETTGLFPLLLDGHYGDPGRPWHDPEDLRYRPTRRIEALNVGLLLRRWWDHYTDEGWPGTAGPGHQADDPDMIADALARRYAHEKPRLVGLVHAARGADALTASGWQGPLNHTNETEEISAVVRSWEDRFAARVVMVGFADLYVSVAAPPATLEHARHVAAEHRAFCPDNIGADFGRYAASLVRAREWRFRWD